MEDLFGIEQKIYDDAILYSMELQNGSGVEKARYDEIVREYGRLLKQLRRSTKVSDRVLGTLNTSKYDLLGKVNYDVLTGIYNRRFMEDSLKRIIKSLARSGGRLSVLMIDVDFFKDYNDTYGHSEGDICLKVVAETISESLLRPDDFVARYGGEEFAVILPNTDENGARFLAGNILENIMTKNIRHETNEATGCITVSVGITTSDVKHTHSGTEYIKRADEALYLSKQNGRNRYTYADFREKA
jgi:diguanylate cyclase (GGDEF)-like protein